MAKITTEMLASLLPKTTIGPFTELTKPESSPGEVDVGGAPVLLINAWLEGVLRSGMHNVKDGKLNNPVFDVWKRAYRLEKPDKAEDSDEDLWPTYSRGVRRARERLKREQV